MRAARVYLDSETKSPTAPDTFNLIALHDDGVNVRELCGFDATEGCMVPLPKGQTDTNTTFLMLAEGRLIFDGSLHDLVASRDPFVREFLE